tara:strand:- start:536 stop:1339 length:804 start_codon:yes stop_codon:yes gene_type:complete
MARDNKKYTMESIVEINIHEGLMKEQIIDFEKSEKDCKDAFESILSSSDLNEAEYYRADDFDELIDELIEAGAENWAIKTCIIKMQYITKSISNRKGIEYAIIIQKLCELKRLSLAEEVLEVALKNVSEFRCYESLGISTSSKEELNNKSLALEIFQKAEDLAVSFSDFNSLADTIVDEDYLGDKNYAKTVYQKAENLAESFKDFLDLGQSYGLYLDKNHARKAFKKAENLAQNFNDLKTLAKTIANENYLGDTVWEKELLQKNKKS